MSKDGKPASLDTTALPALPDGWCWTTLETLADIEGGITKDQKRQSPGMREVPYLRVANVQRGFLDLAEVKTIMAEEEEVQSLRLQKGDVLFTEGGDRDKLGRGWVWNGEIEECIHQNHIFRARPYFSLVDPKFVSYHGNYFGQKWFVRTGKQTTNLASINKGVLRRFPVPLAPRGEQTRIVAKIEELFSDLDAGVAALDRAKAKLKRYRAAVLKAAVEGRLTEQWRAANPPKETASQLLERILKERRRRWEEDQAAAYAKAGKKPPANWKAKYKEPAAPDETNLPALPEGWCWVRTAQIAEMCLGKMLDKQKHVTGVKLPYLRNINVRWWSVDLDDLFEMYFEEDQLDRFGLASGDVLVCEGGEPGRAAVWAGQMASVMFQKAIHRVRCAKGIQPNFIVAFLEYMAKSTRLDRHFTGSTIKHFTGESFAAMPLPLPPAKEQEQIVSEISERLYQIEGSDRVIHASLHRASRLRQSILKRAFEGKLVPQDPKDEPASVLLERIKGGEERTIKTANRATRNRKARRPQKENV